MIQKVFGGSVGPNDRGCLACYIHPTITIIAEII